MAAKPDQDAEGVGGDGPMTRSPFCRGRCLRLLWAFHNAKSGLCFPSYEKIAEAAGCARSTVAEAIKALADAGVLSWVNRIKRVREAAPDLFDGHGWRWRVIRTSNAYNFRDPQAAVRAPVASKSERLEPQIKLFLFFAPSFFAFKGRQSG